MIHWCLDRSQFEFRLKIKRGLCHDVYACVIQSIWRWISWRDFIKRGNFRQLPTKLDLDVVFHVLVFFEIQSKKSFIKVRIFVGCLPLKTMCRCANIIITLVVIGCVSCCVDGKCDTKQSNCREPCTRRKTTNRESNCMQSHHIEMPKVIHPHSNFWCFIFEFLCDVCADFYRCICAMFPSLAQLISPLGSFVLISMSCYIWHCRYIAYYVIFECLAYIWIITNDHDNVN